MALGGLIPRGAAQEIGRVAARVRNMDMTEEEHQECPTSGHDSCGAGQSAAVAHISGGGADLEKTKGHNADDD